jgi:coenzyme F420-0:L-glutamate ligase / coenzyme F420-1:gamma-L-glutamate ligase
MPEVEPGDALRSLIAAALERQSLHLLDDDVLLVCQKIVSKAENRFVDLDAVDVSARARELAMRRGKDPRLVEVILSESTDVVRCAPQALIVRLGLVMANAGVDQSNVPGSDRRVLLLPEHPDRSALRLRESLRKTLGAGPAVVITDTFGRPWRRGVCGTAIGASGFVTLLDRRGDEDRFGRELKVTQVATAAALAAAAALIMGRAPRGARWCSPADCRRPGGTIRRSRRIWFVRFPKIYSNRPAHAAHRGIVRWRWRREAGGRPAAP